jgi:hypothetical protein
VIRPRLARAALAAVVLAAADPAAAAEPRSAIPWLSDSIEHTEAPPPRPTAPTEPPTGAEPDAITVTPLGAVSRDAAGLLGPEQTGFARALWGPASALKVRELILAHPDGGVPEARALFHRVLLAEADPPRGGGAASAVLVARIDRLLGMGALEEAGRLIELSGPETPELFRRWFDVGVLLDEAEGPCAALRENPGLSPTLPARVFCLARGGDWNAAEITLTLGEEVGSIPPEQMALLARFLDPVLFEGEPEPPVPEPLTALDFLMREAVGLPRPQGALPLAFLHHDLGEHTPMRARVEAAERLALSGVIRPAALFETYRAGEPAASGGVWERALAVQALDAALAGPDPEAVGAALVAADQAFAARGLRVAFAEEYGGELARLDPAALPEPAGPVLFELLLLAGDPEAARRGLGAAPEPRQVALLAVAGAGTVPARLEGDLLRAAVDGLTAQAPADDREARLAGLVAGGRQGEAMLEALALVEAGEAVDPPALRAALLTLRLAGQEASARAIALQTLLPGAGRAP